MKTRNFFAQAFDFIKSYKVFILVLVSVIFFATGCKKNPVKPDDPDPVEFKLVSTVPVVNSEITPNDRVSLFFNKGIDPDYINDKIRVKIRNTGDYSPAFTRIIQDSTLVVQSEAGYPENVTIEIYVSELHSVEGDTYPDTFFTWNVVTGPDLFAPQVITYYPNKNDRNVPVTISLAYTFSEAMNPATFVDGSITLARGDTLVGVSLSYDELQTKVIVQPNDSLLYSVRYTATLTSVLTDLAGNHLSTTVTYFTTEEDPRDLTAPYVVSSQPDAGDQTVDITPIITDIFSEAMNPASFTPDAYKLVDVVADTAVSCTITYTAETFTAKLTPVKPLKYETSYSIVLTQGLTDVAGNALADTPVRTFRTREDPTPPYYTSESYIKVIDFDNSGNLYFADNIFLNPGTRTTIGKFDNNGKLQWLKYIGADNLFNQSWGIAVGDDYAYLLRTEESSDNAPGFGDVYVDKWDSEGNLVWTVHVDGPAVQGSDMVIRDNYVYCSTTEHVIRIDVNTKNVYSVRIDDSNSILVNDYGVFVGWGVYSMYLRAYDYDLNEQWTKTFDTPYADGGGYLAAHDHYVYQAGNHGMYYDKPIDPMLVKYDLLTGAVVWDSVYTELYTGYRNYITCDANGIVYMLAFASDAKGSLIAFGPDGEVLWENSAASAFYAKERDGILYVTNHLNKKFSNYIRRFDATTGVQLP